ncbi:hypothetical protein HPB51_026388 [Rhipicephalus microplus]|uniref:Tick transposon n=1 Tax=Rhipicephalus microplus TaxID=6941 RepID=A0A9J6D327_RHIMP|nr:hypothetical protein HPB51_026388 [Rhipicephalus microplus]
MVVPAETVTFAVTFGYMNVADNKRRRDVEVAFDMPDEQFGLADGLAGCALGGAAKVCAPRSFATGSLQSSVGGEETVAVMQPAVGICVRRVAHAVIVNAGTRNKWVHFPRTAEEKVTVERNSFGLDPTGVIGCVDGSFVASRSEQKVPFWCREGCFALNVMFCFRLGHVKGVCPILRLCPRCAEPHAEDTCRTTTLKCANCCGPHAASSKDCPRIQKERAVLRQMTRDNSTHREAAEVVRRRRRRPHHRKSSKKAHSRDAPSHSLAVPSSSATKGPTTSTKETEKPHSLEEWPTLPTLFGQKPLQVVATKEPSSTMVGLPKTDRQVISVLRSLIEAIRAILVDMKTLSARSALGLLGTPSPVLESLN